MPPSIVSLSVLALLSSGASAIRCNATFSNTQLRRGVAGNRVFAQDGNIANAKYNGSFVLVGTSYGDCVFNACANTSAGACGFDGEATRFYVWLSPSLSDGTWSQPIEILPASARPSIYKGAIFFRSHLVYNPLTARWVLWVRWLPPDGPSLSDDPTYYLSASAPSLDAPFAVDVAQVPMYYNNSADDNLFVDPTDGVGYIVHTSRATSGPSPPNPATRITVERLSADFLSSRGATDPSQRSELIGPGGTEAPAMWFDATRNLYFVSFSPLCCYCVKGSTTQVWTSATPLGPYTFAGSLGNAPAAQQNWVLSDPLLIDGVLWGGTRWGSDPTASAPAHAPIFDNGLQYWAPIAFAPNGSVLPIAWANETVVVTEVDAPACPTVPSPLDDGDLVRAHVAAHANDTFRQPSGYIKYPYLVPSGGYQQIWDWDSLFMGVALRDYGSTPYFVGTFKTFLESTNVSTGELPGCITPDGPAATLYHAKPVIIQGALLAGKQAGNVSQFAIYAPQMRALLLYWNSTTRRDSVTGLSRWHDQLETGSDNLVFSECPSSYSPECWTESIAFSLASTDASVWLAREYIAYSLFTEAWSTQGIAVPGLPLFASDAAEEARAARAAAAAIGDAINNYLWVCTDATCDSGYFGAYNVTTREQIKSRTWQAAFPTWAGLSSNASRAEASLASASLPDLMGDYGLRSTSNLDLRYNNSNIIDPYSQWRGPVWVNAAVLHAHALRGAGFTSAAMSLANAVVHTLAQDLRVSGEWHESYDSETGLGLAAPGFLSWDTLGGSIQEDIAEGKDPFILEL